MYVMKLMTAFKVSVLRKVSLPSETVAAIALVSIVLLAFALRFRWLLLAINSSLPLPPDAVGYMEGASSLLRFSYRMPREPIFPLVAALFFSVLGVAPAALRFTTVCLGTLMVYPTYKIARRIYGAPAGLLASLLVATDYLLIWNSIRGLREELFSCLLLALVYLTFLWKNKLTTKTSMIAGFLSAIICLTKLEGFVVVLGIAAYHIWHSGICQRRFNWKFLACILGFSIIAIFAWFAFSAMTFNNPFETTTIQGTWWYHYEFGGEWRRVTAFDYLFRFHNIREILFLSVRGFARVLCMLNELWFLTPIGLGLLCLGFLSLLKSERNVMLNYVLLSGLLSNVFFFGVAAGADSRLLYPYIPFLYVVIAYATTSLHAILARRRESTIKSGQVSDWPVFRKIRVRLLTSRCLRILTVFLPFVIIAIHLAGYLMSLPRP